MDDFIWEEYYVNAEIHTQLNPVKQKCTKHGTLIHINSKISTAASVQPHPSTPNLTTVSLISDNLFT